MKALPQKLEEDLLIRKTLDKLLQKAHYQSIEIERKGDKINITIYTAKPGIIIKHGGEGLDEIKRVVSNTVAKYRKKNHLPDTFNISLNIEEIRKPFAYSQIVAFEIADDIERRMPYRSTIKKYLERIMANREVKGAKILVSGRLDGSENRRDDFVKDGKLPLNTLRSNIDYGTATAHCTYGTVGIKV